ncbi:MAG: hypothetical protein SGJ24_12855 [Chloroflexota bacterium]|nr:hypothetical protein [Chloroflexota bacterium]
MRNRYIVAPGSHEAVYSDMPAFGLALATRHIAISGRRESARGRMTDHASIPVP